MIAIIDYGMGNLRSVQKAFEFIGSKAVVTNNRKIISNSSLIVLPGVGSFAAAMSNLKKLNLIGTIKEGIADGKPYLGLCLGLQMLFERSEEGHCKGFGVLRGEVKKFPNIYGLKVPHMGWNDITIKRKNSNLKGIRDGTFFYFVHSYYVKPMDSEISVATCNYGMEFAACLGKGNVFATQFHPEKSQDAGLQILKNWIS